MVHMSLIDTMTSNIYSSRCASKKTVEVFEVDHNTALAAQISTIQQQPSQIMNVMNAPFKT